MTSKYGPRAERVRDVFVSYICFEQAGWQCPLCTFVNEPTRPGCEACTSPRPDDYVVPDHYEMSEREKERIRNERELDKLSEQVRQLYTYFVYNIQTFSYNIT